MKKTIKLTLLLFISATLFCCSSDDDGGESTGPTGESKIYNLGSIGGSNITGTAKFIENFDNSTTIELDLSGTTEGNMHPAHIHYNTALEGGEIALTLGAVDGSTGFSSITSSALNDGTPINYEDFLAFDGYINVHLSADELETIVSQGNIGQNELSVD